MKKCMVKITSFRHFRSPLSSQEDLRLMALSYGLPEIFYTYKNYTIIVQQTTLHLVTTILLYSSIPWFG